MDYQKMIRDLSLTVNHGGPGPHKNGTPQSVHGGEEKGDISGEAAKDISLLKDSQPRGFTYDPVGRGAPKTGIMSATTLKPIFAKTATEVTAEDIQGALDQYAYQLKQKNVYFGGWIDSADGVFYADISTPITTGVEDAIRFGAATKQIALWNIDAEQEIRIGDWLEAHPDFQIDPAIREHYKNANKKSSG